MKIPLFDADRLGTNQKAASIGFPDTAAPLPYAFGCDR
jgi:hypothetical protein